MRHAAPLLLALVLAGCVTMTGDPGATARAALDELFAGIRDGTGSLSKLEGTLSGGGYSAPFSLEISRDGTRHFNLSAGMFVMDVYCRGDKTVRMIGGEPFAARGGCPLDGGRLGAPDDALDKLNVSSVGRDGAMLVVVFEGPPAPPDALDEDDRALFGSTASLKLTIDGRGNARHVEMSAPGASGMNATASHEPRKRGTLPETDQRLAAAIDADADFHDGVYGWKVDDAYDNASLDEIEVRVQGVGQRAGAGSATFDPSDGSEQNVSGFVFQFDDADSDGRLSEGDGFTLTNPDWRYQNEYEVVVWDTWADAPLAGRRIPGPPVVLALALAFALALVVRHRVSRQRG